MLIYNILFVLGSWLISYVALLEFRSVSRRNLPCSNCDAAYSAKLATIVSSVIALCLITYGPYAALTIGLLALLSSIFKIVGKR